MLPVVVWSAAHAEGAALIIRPDAEGAVAMTTTDFIEHRTESGQTYTAPERCWVRVPQSESLADVGEAIFSAETTSADEPEPESRRFVSLHTHSEFSLLLSLIHISEPTRRLRGSRMPSSA